MDDSLICVHNRILITPGTANVRCQATYSFVLARNFVLPVQSKTKAKFFCPSHTGMTSILSRLRQIQLRLHVDTQQNRNGHLL